MSRSDSALLFDPHLSTVGGGERYLWSFAGVLRASGLDVTVAGPALPSDNELARLGFPSTVRLAKMTSPGFTAHSAGCALSLWLDNAVPRPSLARRRLAVLSFPFQDLALDGRFSWRRAAVRGVDDVIVYSDFAREWTRLRWGRDASVIPPAVELRAYEAKRKERLILSVGRFFPDAHSKRQDVLIEAFRRFTATPEGSGWRLVLAGGLDRSRPDHVAWYEARLLQAAGLEVEFATSVASDRLAALYARASLFWHATGFERAAGSPERAEHFGITTVEAMSAGAVPLVYADGGQLEVVDSSFGGLWRTVDELVALTADAASGDLTAKAKAAVQRSRAWDSAAFTARVKAILEL